MLPRAIEYSLPTAQDLPQDRVSWALEPSRAALLVHDMQEHFIGAYRTDSQPLVGVRAHTAALLASARAAGIPIFYTAQPSHQTPEARGLLNDMWGAGIGEDSTATAVVPDLAPAPHDTVLTKWRYDAFERSDFRERLASAGRDQLIITGIYAHIGCQATAVRAFMLDVQPFFVADAVADFSYEQHISALKLVADCAGVTLTTADVLAAIEGGSRLSAAAVNAAPSTAELDATAESDATRFAAAAATDAQYGTTLLDADDPSVPTEWSHLVAQLSEVTGTEPAHISPDSDLMSLGVDSVRLMALAEAWSTSSAVLGFTDLILCDTPQDVVRLLEQVHGVEFEDLAGVAS